MVRLGAEMTQHLVELPSEIIYELALAPAVRLAAWGTELDDEQLERVIESCWRAIRR